MRKIYPSPQPSPTRGEGAKSNFGLTPSPLVGEGWGEGFIFILILIFSLLSSAASAQLSRQTSFDDRPTCEENKGVWRQYGNGCIDQCRPKLDQFSICTQALTFGCDCGKGRCWHDGGCMLMKDYKKIFDEEQIAEQKILDEAKEKRKAMAQQVEEEIMNNLLKKTAEAIEKSATATGEIRTNIEEFVELPNQQNQAPAPTVPAQSAIVAAPTNSAPINAIVPAQSIPINSAPAEVPEYFLRKEQAKQDAAKQQNTPTTTTPSQGATTLPTLPGLPVIPLPN